MKHEPSREVSDDEQALWDAVKSIEDRDGWRDLTPNGGACDRTGVRPERGRQIARSWDNEGLVALKSEGANRVALTEYGRQVDSIESGLPSGESWR